MYKCQNDRCEKIVSPRTPENIIITKTREKTYTNPGKKKHYDPIVTHGTEIVEEIRVCPKCYQVLTGREPGRQRASQNVRILTTQEKKKPSRRKRRPGRPGRNPPRTRKPNEKKVVVERVNPLKVIKE